MQPRKEDDLDLYPLAAGTALAIEANLLDGSGQAQVYTAPGPVLTAEVWPGGSRAASFVVAATWIDPTVGTVLLSILPSQTAPAEPDLDVKRTHAAAEFARAS